MLTLNNAIEGVIIFLISIIAYFLKSKYAKTDNLLEDILSSVKEGQIQRAEILKDILTVQSEIEIIRDRIEAHGSDISELKTSVARLEEWRKYESQRKK